jgi:hypothetical protein
VARISVPIPSASIELSQNNLQLLQIRKNLLELIYRTARISKGFADVIEQADCLHEVAERESEAWRSHCRNDYAVQSCVVVMD